MSKYPFTANPGQCVDKISRSDWDFFSSDDPTHGNVNYQTRQNAQKKNLAFVQPDGTTILAVDDFSIVPVGGKRDS